MGYIKIEGVEKSFGATRALAGVDLSLAQGEVHGLLGENGAGKSTLMKVLAGVVTPDAGSVSIDGATLELGRPQASRAAGLGIAYQELSSPGNVDVATKLCWPNLPRGWSGLVSRAKMRDRASEILSRFRLESVDPALLIADADLATRQRVEIVAAMARDPKLLVLDEPTGALPDTDWLFDAVRRMAADGTAVIYISHKLPEIEEICDRGTVLRSGRTVGTFERGSVNETELVEMMIGRSFEQSFPARHAGPEAADVVVAVKTLAAGDRLREADLTVRRGEIVGLAGLEGQGQKDLVYALHGQVRTLGGSIDIDRGDAAVSTSLVPEERKTEALFAEMTSEFNLTVASMGAFSAGPLINRSREQSVALEAAQRVNLPEPMLAKQISTLSGGNQQKVIFGRAVARDPACLLLFDPTRGVDAATKFEIYEMTREFANRGRGVLLYSTEIPELVGLCDRVYVVAGGRIVSELVGDEISETAVMSAALAWKDPVRDPGSDAEKESA
ncbi:sugar ABC transporter ATP-binding protein [Gordonia westfalica]|uniref:Monosaccharide ABC transporter ATP-binding protein, CUT2 family n=1 Tax=Gordonia westfalica TaxID=158898 RepID=A0A1H2JX33_9ACTN|nr:sugar ABC transporter ATP-binding protein [Gordonia westfalica]SDU60665.1 monosaccharide ABC transporter ATP-binding protein, CUT2 family [Gordonia westfalica]